MPRASPFQAAFSDAHSSLADLVVRRPRLWTLAHAIGLAIAVIAHAPEAHASEPIPVAPELVAPPVELDRWKGLSFGTYLAPKADFVTADGGVDVVFHFHAGQMAERQMRESGMNAVFVSCGYGIGSGAYANAFASPERFGRMLDELVKNVETSTGRHGLHVRHIALTSWSAGFAAVGKILGVERYYAMVDSVVLNDSLHSQYLDPIPKPVAHGPPPTRAVDLKMIRSFIRFAKDAAAGNKAMVITHSAIVPPDYASSTEATQALLTAIEVPTTIVDETSSRGMNLTKRADAGNLHVRGFRGAGPRDHFNHLHLIGETLRSWVVPRWKREDRLVYTLVSEQL
jgi:hypothetical protein